jgi:hypothetical protein
MSIEYCNKKPSTYITWYNDREINMNVDRDEMFHSELWCFKLFWKMTLLKTFFPILFSIVNILIAKIQLPNMRVVIYSETCLNRTLVKPKTWLNQTDFTVPSTKCLCNLNLCKPNTCLNWTNLSVPKGFGVDRIYCITILLFIYFNTFEGLLWS